MRGKPLKAIKQRSCNEMGKRGIFHGKRVSFDQQKRLVCLKMGYTPMEKTHFKDPVIRKCHDLGHTDF